MAIAELENNELIDKLRKAGYSRFVRQFLQQPSAYIAANGNLKHAAIRRAMNWNQDRLNESLAAMRRLLPEVA